MNTHNEPPAPYGDRRPAPDSARRSAPWNGGALGVLVIALALFAGAAAVLLILVLRVLATYDQNTGADIAVGLLVVVFLTLVLSACGLVWLAKAIRLK